jgi:hypothetical protein
LIIIAESFSKLPVNRVSPGECGYKLAVTDRELLVHVVIGLDRSSAPRKIRSSCGLNRKTACGMTHRGVTGNR